MSLELDLELRLAVFDHVRRLSQVSGGAVTARALNEGLTFHGQRVPIWNQQKGIFRPRFSVIRALPLQFKLPSTAHTTTAWIWSDDRLVYRYRGTDPNQSDNVALRRAMELGRPLLYLVAVEQGLYEPVCPTYVAASSRPSSPSI